MANIYDMTDTWNNGATTFTAIKMDVSDSASAANSLLLDLKVDGVTKASIDKDGNLTANFTLTAIDNVPIGATTPSTGAFTTLTASTIDGAVIGGTTAAAGTFTTMNATSIETTNIKAKDGTSAGSIADSTGVVTIASAVLTTADINGGAIDGSVVGGTNAAAGTFTALSSDYLNETVYELTGTDIDPANGAIQYKTLGANTTFTESLSSGDSVILRLSGGDTYTVTWPTISWVTGSGDVEPTLTGSDVFVLWKESTTVYGAYVGSYA